MPTPASLSTMPAVEVDHLVVRYGSLVAVDGVSFDADFGEVVALLGPNGAGKTTTVETLEGFRRAEAAPHGSSASTPGRIIPAHGPSRRRPPTRRRLPDHERRAGRQALRRLLRGPPGSR